MPTFPYAINGSNIELRTHLAPTRRVMSIPRVLRRVLMNFALGTVAPLVFAQAAPDDSVDGHGGRANIPQWQACKEQADGKNLQPGEERKAFMRDCLHSTQVL